MATTSHIDYRKIDYDQLIDKPIIRTTANVNDLTSAGVYDKGDGKRIIVTVDGNNVTQVIEEKNGYQERTSTNGGSSWGTWDTVVFSDSNDKWDKVIISDTEPANPVETTAWINITDDSFNVYDGSDWITIAGGTAAEVPYIPTFEGIMDGTTKNFTNDRIEAGDGIILVGTTSGHPAGIWEYNVSVGGFTINSTESERLVKFKYLIVKSDGIAMYFPAENTTYDNTESWLNAENVQDAIDELAELASHGSQVDTMPEATAEAVGTIVQYVGDTNQYYTNAYFYKCIEDPENPGQYIWEKIEVQDSNADAEDIAYDNTISWMDATNVQDAIDEIDTSVDTINTTIETIQWDITNIEGDITDIKNIVEVTTIDTPTAEDEGNIIQYKGETTASFTQGYFYKCVESSTTPWTYEWVRIDVQPNTGGEDIIYVTQAEYDLVPAADKADPTKHYAVYEIQPTWAVASSIVYITEANYDLLTPEEKMAENVHYYIVESL